MRLFPLMLSKVVSIVIWLCSFSLVVAWDMVEEATHLLEAGKQREEETVVSQYPLGQPHPNSDQTSSRQAPPPYGMKL